MTKHPFGKFLGPFIEKVSDKSEQVNQAFWLLEVTGSQDAAKLKSKLSLELRELFSRKREYDKLLLWQREDLLTDPLLKRQLDLLIRNFKPNLISKKLREAIAQQEARLCYTFANFRPTFQGKLYSDNDFRELLKTSSDRFLRQQAWSASKEVGKQVSLDLLKLVKLRNEAAQSVGYSDYFQMQLDLQEIDGKWLLKTFDQLAKSSAGAYKSLRESIHEQLQKRFQCHSKELGPWAWSDPFCQEDPLAFGELDLLVQGADLIGFCKQFYEKMGFDLSGVIAHSDMYERAGKSQHAFCVHMDRMGDVRTLNNVKPTLKWFETLFHEFGHAIYEMGLGENLPWLLKEPPHMLMTEAMALLGGRWAYRALVLKELNPNNEPRLMQQAGESLKRRQLIFSRWVLVMTYFESELYRDPDQDLQALWWHLVGEYQGIETPQNRPGSEWADWACKVHLSLSPVYYFSYLLGEMVASSIEELLEANFHSKELSGARQGQFLKSQLFAPGNSLRWDQLFQKLTKQDLESKAWVLQFAS